MEYAYRYLKSLSLPITNVDSVFILHRSNKSILSYWFDLQLGLRR